MYALSVTIYIIYFVTSTYNSTSATQQPRPCFTINSAANFKGNMSSVKKLTSELSTQLMLSTRDIQPDIRSCASSLLQATFGKTRFASHTKFITNCLRRHVIPNGFQLKHHSGLPSSDFTHHRQVTSTLATASRKLMRNTLQTMLRRKEHFSSERELYKSRLQDIAAPDVRKSIFHMIHELNQKLHNYLVDCKSRKFEHLLTQFRVNHRNDNQTTPRDNKLVVTIPEDLQITDAERSVLSKGLKFIPVDSKNNDFKTRCDVDAFFRRLRLKAHFHDQNKDGDNNPPSPDPFDKLQPKHSTWTPPPGQLKTLDSTIEKARNEVISQLKRKRHINRNITSQEHQALQSLRDNDNIVIKQADKGGAVVVWRKDLYRAEAERQLSDTSSYQLLEKDQSSNHQTIIKSTVTGFIKKKELPNNAVNLINTAPRTAEFYMLPKIHKPNIPGRPIISAHSCPTALISQYLDDVMRPMVESLPTYVKDSSHALRIFDTFKFNGDTNFVFTMDVSSLYTSIPHDAGLKALRHFLDQREHKYPATATLLRLAELVLTLNNFTFNGCHYLQVRGVAMGTKFGPAYACLFMGYIEQEFIRSYSGHVPNLFLRYIDDYFGATSGTREDLELFITHLSNYHPSIKFTSAISEETVPFLDLAVSIQPDTRSLTTSIYYKPTDAHNYLLHSSSHPPKCKDSIPYSQLLRLRRICSSEEDFKSNSQTMAEYFAERDYPETTIQDAVRRVSDIERTTALEPSVHDDQDRIPLVIAYHPANLPIRNILLKHYTTLSNDNTTQHIFDKPPLVSFRRERNIANYLIRASFPDPRHLPKGTKPCGGRLCHTCKFIAPNIAKLKGPSGTVNISQSFTCKSHNLIYAIICKKCGKLYIGETKNQLSVRFSAHLRSIKKQDNIPVANHFNNNGHSLDDLTVIVVLSTSGNSDSQRHICEQRLIHELGTRTPNGMNIMFNAFK